MSIKRKTEFLVLSVLVLLAVGSISFAAHCGLTFNVTDSVPIGLYRMTDSTTGSYVLFCPTGQAASVANERGYRPRSIGNIACSDGFAPLGKPIAAREGDVVHVDEHGIAVNGVPLKNSGAKRIDGKGRAMPRIPYGTYTVPSDAVWVVSTYNPMSYDSRYFGPISLSRIISYERPLWIF
jgi:conjugative transfer signal peptidase TraF